MKVKYLIFLLTLSLYGNTIFAQMSPPDFDAAEAAGLIKYDSESVIKKLKIQEDSIIILVSKHIQTYNQEMDNLIFIYGNTLKELENEFDRNVKIAFQNRDRSQMDGVKAKIKQTIPPIRYEVNEFEKTLNESLAQILTEKENNKWLKYQKSKKPSIGNF
ncbi:hypothetical protein SAMN05192553_107140 [Cyclobacterium xiamenense]|uniref:LTXXQ motif family protein n=1 Tax=Cyclobacterium xiamenense TaxID=1297121 RepID=A0A1H7AKD9_9BACT|nr:hypothetical protein [Cyclobacterium xiamenense]SEJ66101.1 hypothetical protein SAMN05192553_107140 [Cyclobacterium xiamenense]